MPVSLNNATTLENYLSTLGDIFADYSCTHNLQRPPEDSKTTEEHYKQLTSPNDQF